MVPFTARPTDEGRLSNRVNNWFFEHSVLRKRAEHHGTSLEERVGGGQTCCDLAQDARGCSRDWALEWVRKLTLMKVCTQKATCQDEGHDACTQLPGTPARCVVSPHGMVLIWLDAEHVRWNGTANLLGPCAHGKLLASRKAERTCCRELQAQAVREECDVTARLRCHYLRWSKAWRVPLWLNRQPQQACERFMTRASTHELCFWHFKTLRFCSPTQMAAARMTVYTWLRREAT